jgi:hypothetical protein
MKATVAWAGRIGMMRTTTLTMLRKGRTGSTMALLKDEEANAGEA